MDKQILGPVKQEKWGKTYSAARVISVTAISARPSLKSQDTGRNPRAVSQLVFASGSGSVPLLSSEFLDQVPVLVCF